MVKFIVKILMFALSFIMIMCGQWIVFAAFSAQTSDINQIAIVAGDEEKKVAYLDAPVFMVHDVVENFQTQKIGVRSRFPGGFQWLAVACDTVWNVIESAKTVVAPIKQGDNLAYYRNLQLRIKTSDWRNDPVYDIFEELYDTESTTFPEPYADPNNPGYYYNSAEGMYYDVVLNRIFSGWNTMSKTTINQRKSIAGIIMARQQEPVDGISFPYTDGVTVIQLTKGDDTKQYTFKTADFMSLTKKYLGDYIDDGGVVTSKFNTAYYKYCDYKKFTSGSYDKYMNHFLTPMANTKENTITMDENGLPVITDVANKFKVKSEMPFAFFQLIIGLIFTVILMMQTPVIFRRASDGMSMEVEGANVPVVGYLKTRHELNKQKKALKAQKKAAKAQRKAK